MPYTTDRIYNEALLLPNNAQIILVEKLLKNIGSNINEDILELQVREAKKRRDDVHSGRVQPVPGEEALRSVRNIPAGSACCDRGRSQETRRKK